MSASVRRGVAERGARLASATLIVAALLGRPAIGVAQEAPPDTSAARPASADSVSAPPDSSRAAPDTATVKGLTVTGNVEGRRIRRIDVDARGIFDPTPTDRFRFFYKLVDKLHVTTRDAAVRQQLPIEPGDKWTLTRGRETMRMLRDMGILNPQGLAAVERGDSVDVEVVTRDAWSTSAEFTAAGGGGQLKGSFSLIERNLFGWGKKIGFSYRDDLVATSKSLEFQDPAVFGSRLRFSVVAADGSDGASQSLYVGVPFYAEHVRQSFGYESGRTTSIARLFLDDVQTAEFDRRRERAEVWYARGHQRGRSIWRGIASFRLDDRRLGPSRLAPDAPPDFAGEEDNHRVRQPTLEGRYWRPRFVERTRVNELGGVEDFDLGTRLAITGGFSFHALGATADEGFFGVSAGVGGEAGSLGYGWVSVDASSRFRQIPQEGRIMADARWVAPIGDRNVLVVGVRAEKLKRPPRDLQVIYGGLNGVRAFGVNELAGEAGWRWNIEERFALRRPIFKTVEVGTAVFLDAAQIDGPGIDQPRFCDNVGAGLRISIPRFSSNRVARLDVAWPLQGANGKRDVVWSFGSSQAF